MIISRSKRNYVSCIDFNTNNEELIYCDRCNEVGIKSRLGKIVLEPDVPVPVDYDLWLQCYTCGKIVSIRNIKHESKIVENIQVDNKPIFTSMESKKKRRHKVGIRRYESKIGLKDKDKEINELIRKGYRVTVHQ